MLFQNTLEMDFNHHLGMLVHHMLLLKSWLMSDY